MADKADFDFFEDEKEYDIERLGAYGRFYTRSSYPIMSMFLRE
ncbi:hypothetical protein [Pseudomonas aeruginosa]|nr:hypothetical protein [Pseudomonas aeruginosa]